MTTTAGYREDGNDNGSDGGNSSGDTMLRSTIMAPKHRSQRCVAGTRSPVATRMLDVQCKKYVRRSLRHRIEPSPRGWQASGLLYRLCTRRLVAAPSGHPRAAGRRGRRG